MSRAARDIAKVPGGPNPRLLTLSPAATSYGMDELKRHLEAFDYVAGLLDELRSLERSGAQVPLSALDDRLLTCWYVVRNLQGRCADFAWLALQAEALVENPGDAAAFERLRDTLEAIKDGSFDLEVAVVDATEQGLPLADRF